MVVEDRFKLEVSKSIQNKKHLSKERDYYYIDKYAQKIKTFYRKNKVSSYEILRNDVLGAIPICSFTSSTRLGYLYFSRNDKAKFELSLPSDIENSYPTKFDAKIDNVYYECNCQEIINKSHGYGIPASYQWSSELFKEFGIQNYLENKIIEIRDENDSLIEVQQYLRFMASELDINLKKDTLYTNMHFDLKQFICLLIALAKSGNEKKTLKYLYFIPDDISSIEDVYSSLKDEIKAIKKSNKIKAFCDKYNIKLDLEEYIKISSVEDFNYIETFEK